MARFACVCAAVSVGLVAAGCGSATTTEAAAKKDVKSEYDQSGRLTRLTYDRNGDGKIDTWGYMDGSRVVRVEVDEDGDGKVDRWEYHKDPSGRWLKRGRSRDRSGRRRRHARAYRPRDKARRQDFAP